MPYSKLFYCKNSRRSSEKNAKSGRRKKHSLFNDSLWFTGDHFPMAALPLLHCWPCWSVLAVGGQGTHPGWGTQLLLIFGGHWPTAAPPQGDWAATPAASSLASGQERIQFEDWLPPPGHLVWGIWSWHPETENDKQFRYLFSLDTNSKEPPCAIITQLATSVSDPYSLNPDPDPDPGKFFSPTKKFAWNWREKKCSPQNHQKKIKLRLNPYP